MSYAASRSETFSHDARVCLRDVEQGTLIRTLYAQTGWGRAGTCSPEGRWIASGSIDGTVKLGDVPIVRGSALAALLCAV